MDPLAAAHRITRSIPATPEYRHELRFCLGAVGRAALVTGDTGVFHDVLSRAEGRTEAELRLAAAYSTSPVRAEILADFAERLSYWEEQIHTAEISGLAPVLATAYGVPAAASAAEGIADPYIRTTFLVALSRQATDPVLRRKCIIDARQAATAIADDDRDYALMWAASGAIDAGLLEEARSAVDEMHDPSMRLDYLRLLSEALDAASRDPEAAVTPAKREAVAAEHPDERPRSEVLGEAEPLPSSDLPGMPRRAEEVFVKVDGLIGDGSMQEALNEIKSRFPARFVPSSLLFNGEDLDGLLSFQFGAVLGYARTDLLVEFLTDLAIELHRSSRSIGEQAQALLDQAAILEVPRASAPPLTFHDPSTMSMEEFVRFLFDRPVARTQEEERAFNRSFDDDPDVEDSANLVALSANLFTRFAEITLPYSREQVDQAMWILNCRPLWLGDRLRDSSGYTDTGIECSKAVLHVFSDYVANLPPPIEETSFNMWWDNWRDIAPGPVLDSAFETVLRVLEIDNEECRYAALHGLNHLPHPGTAAAVDQFLLRHGSELTEEMVTCANACRDRKAM